MSPKSITLVVIIAIVIGIAVFFAYPLLIQKPTGHEVLGTPDKSYLGLAEVFDGKPKIEVSTRMVQIDDGGVNFSGFLAEPVKDGRYPGIIMIHEWWGLNDQIKSMADILAREEYVVLAVDLFEGKVATMVPDAQANIRNNPPEKTIPKMQSAIKYLRGLPDVDPNKIASLGWCWGGGGSFLIGVNENLQATVIYYGQTSKDKMVLDRLREPVIGFFGAQDQSIPVEDVREFERILKEQGTSVDIFIYENAGHGFANPTNTQAFRKDEALDAWNKTLVFLNSNLKS